MSLKFIKSILVEIFSRLYFYKVLQLFAFTACKISLLSQFSKYHLHIFAKLFCIHNTQIYFQLYSSKTGSKFDNKIKIMTAVEV